MIHSLPASLVTQHIQVLQDYKTRYSYTPDCEKASEYVHAVLVACGLQVEYHNFTYGAADLRNVVGTLQGTKPGPIYILCAHYDSQSSTPYILAPGADDNGSGTAAVLAAAQVLSNYQFNYTIKFVAFGGEEQNLRGSAAYARMLSNQGTNVGGVLNLDMVGYNPPATGNRIRSRGNVASMDLANFTHNVSVKYPEAGLNVTPIQDGATNSDHSAFWQYGWDAVHYFEYSTINPDYHRPTDTIDKLNLTYAANATQNALAAIAELAQVNSTDVKGPSVHDPLPQPDGYGNETPTISIRLTDPSGVSAQLFVNGGSVPAIVSPAPMGLKLTYDIPTLQPDGAIVRCVVIANDSRGNPTTYWWNFTVDAVTPGAPMPSTIELARVWPTKQGVAVNLGPPGSYDSDHAMSPYVLHALGEYKMWYVVSDGATYKIAYANSSDGLAWSKYGVVLSPTFGQQDSMYLADCSVILDAGEYKMWYSGYNGTTYRIFYANSSDGLSWTKQGVVVDLGSTGSLDDRRTLSPSVLKTGSEYVMWYAGSDGVNYRILQATSNNGINWTRRGAVIGPGERGDLDWLLLQGPSVVPFQGGYLCWYTGYDGLRYRILKATSPDGQNWTKLGVAIELGATGSFDYIATTYPCALLENGTTKLWYSGSDNKYRILYANASESGSGTNKESVVLQWLVAGLGEVAKFEVYIAPSMAASLVPPAIGWRAAQEGTFVHNGGGVGNDTNCYYAIRSVDRVSHCAIHWRRAAKVAARTTGGYTPVGSPFGGSRPLDQALETVPWCAAIAWDAGNLSGERWHTNFTARPWPMNDLTGLAPFAGCWANVTANTTYVSVGIVENNTVALKAGWNFVALPHVSQVNCSAVLAEIGAACTSVEGYEPQATYKLRALSGSDSISPAWGYWLYLTADTVWQANNY